MLFSSPLIHRRRHRTLEKYNNVTMLDLHCVSWPSFLRIPFPTWFQLGWAPKQSWEICRVEGKQWLFCSWPAGSPHGCKTAVGQQVLHLPQLLWLLCQVCVFTSLRKSPGFCRASTPARSEAVNFGLFLWALACGCGSQPALNIYMIYLVYCILVLPVQLNPDTQLIHKGAEAWNPIWP